MNDERHRREHERQDGLPDPERPIAEPPSPEPSVVDVRTAVEMLATARDALADLVLRGQGGSLSAEAITERVIEVSRVLEGARPTQRSEARRRLDVARYSWESNTQSRLEGLSVVGIMDHTGPPGSGIDAMTTDLDFRPLLVCRNRRDGSLLVGVLRALDVKSTDGLPVFPEDFS